MRWIVPTHRPRPCAGTSVARRKPRRNRRYCGAVTAWWMQDFFLIDALDGDRAEAGCSLAQLLGLLVDL